MKKHFPLKNIREEFGLSKIAFSKITGVSIRTIYSIENREKKIKKETMIRIRKALKEKFNHDIFEKYNINFIWDIEELNGETLSILEGGLLSDGCIAKASIYTHTARDGKYLKWLAGLLSQGGLESKVIRVKSKSSFSKSYSYYLYTHMCPAMLQLRNQWYMKIDGKNVKRVVHDLEITPMLLLHWYLGDGCLTREYRKDKKCRPYIRLYTNGFLKEDIEMLIEKLSNIDIVSTPVPKLCHSKATGYVLYIKPSSVLNFFKYIGTEPLKEIENCVTRVIKNRKVYRFRDKWPSNEEWLTLIGKNPNIGNIIRKERLKADLTQRELALRIGLKRKHTISDYEKGRKYPSIKRFEKILETLNIDVSGLIGN